MKNWFQQWQSWILLGFLAIGVTFGIIGWVTSGEKEERPLTKEELTQLEKEKPTICSFEAAPRSGEVPLWVEFTAEVKSSESDAWPMEAVFHFYDDTSHLEGIAAPPKKAGLHCASAKVKHEYKCSGDYGVILEVTDAKGRKAAEAKVIVVVSNKHSEPPVDEKYEAYAPIPLKMEEGVPVTVIEAIDLPPRGIWSTLFLVPEEADSIRRVMSLDADYDIRFLSGETIPVKAHGVTRFNSRERHFHIRPSTDGMKMTVYLTR